MSIRLALSKFEEVARMLEKMEDSPFEEKNSLYVLFDETEDPDKIFIEKERDGTFLIKYHQKDVQRDYKKSSPCLTSKRGELIEGIFRKHTKEVITRIINQSKEIGINFGPYPLIVHKS